MELGKHIENKKQFEYKASKHPRRLVIITLRQDMLDEIRKNAVSEILDKQAHLANKIYAKITLNDIL